MTFHHDDDTEPESLAEADARLAGWHPGNPGPEAIVSPAWLNLDAIVPASLRADVADLKDATLDMLRAIEVWIVRAGDTALRYEAATDIRYERVDMEGVLETIDDLTGFEDVRDLVRLAGAVIAAHLDPGDMPMEFDQMAKLTAELLSTVETRSPIMGFIARAENEVERRADRREALGHLR